MFMFGSVHIMFMWKKKCHSSLFGSTVIHANLSLNLLGSFVFGSSLMSKESKQDGSHRNTLCYSACMWNLDTLRCLETVEASIGSEWNQLACNIKRRIDWVCCFTSKSISNHHILTSELKVHFFF